MPQKRLSIDPRYALNTICPYYTMFPLEFPNRILKRASKDSIVLDPFCGRGTTNYAARLRGIYSVGVDTSPIAVAIAKAKLANTPFERIVELVEQMLEDTQSYDLPTGEFWDWAFHPQTLHQICKLRSGLLKAKETDDTVMLRALILGCLHGPRQKDINNPSYFSNQMPRTFASKPKYSVRYWKEHELQPLNIDIRCPLYKKANRVLSSKLEIISHPGSIFLGDSRQKNVFKELCKAINLVITSPPYYGMTTYVQDQWLRNWFLGGSSEVDYQQSKQVSHSSTEDFSISLSKVWNNIYSIAQDNIRMIIRFGSLSSRPVEHQEILLDSLRKSEAPWKIYLRRSVEPASKGRRQVEHMGARVQSTALEEVDYFIRLD